MIFFVLCLFNIFLLDLNCPIVNLREEVRLLIELIWGVIFDFRKENFATTLVDVHSCHE